MGVGVVGFDVLDALRYVADAHPSWPPQRTGTQPLLALPRVSTLEPSRRIVMTEPETGAVLQFRPPPPVPVTVRYPFVPEVGGVVGAGVGFGFVGVVGVDDTDT